jgi:hypothetical protein
MWNEERRKRQADNCRETAPWTHSTGPRSSAGKARVSQNALKHGLRGGILRRAADFIAQSRKIMKELEHE